MHPSLSHSRRGFTLIELIIVIAIIAVIAAGVFVALDPVKRLNSGRNATRWTDVTSVLGAIKLFQTDSPTGALPFVIDSVPGSVQVLGTNVPACTTTVCTGAGIASLAPCLPITGLAAYLPILPFDPSTGSAPNTRYFVNKDANQVITVGACDAQGEGPGGVGSVPTIKVSH